MPTNAEAIANFINAATNRNITRMDIMMAFGQKSYLLAQDQTDRVLAVMGWQVENLITRVDEFYLAAKIPAKPVVESLIVSVEAASKDLQSEVAFFFLPGTVAADLVGSFEQKIGHFFARDTYRGTPVIVVFRWDVRNPERPIWSQAFSTDEGKTWEWNSINVSERAR